MLVAAMFCEYLLAALFSGSDCRPVRRRVGASARRQPIWPGANGGAFRSGIRDRMEVIMV